MKWIANVLCCSWVNSRRSLLFREESFLISFIQFARRIVCWYNIISKNESLHFLCYVYNFQFIHNCNKWISIYNGYMCSTVLICRKQNGLFIKCGIKYIFNKVNIFSNIILFNFQKSTQIRVLFNFSNIHDFESVYIV